MTTKKVILVLILINCPIHKRPNLILSKEQRHTHSTNYLYSTYKNTDFDVFFVARGNGVKRNRQEKA